MSNPTYSALLEQVVDTVRAAGALVMAVYQTEFSAHTKADASPVTEADERAEALIVAALLHYLPGVPVVAEEAVAAGHQPAVANLFWLVDPLDGTKEFISRNGEFTVNVALVENGAPVLGVVFAPAIDKLFAGAVGVGAFVEDASGRRSIACRDAPAAGLTVVASRSHGDAEALDAYLKPFSVAELRSAGSSLKFCLVACGEADLYPRLGRTMEWDIAAGHALLLASGGSVVALSGEPLTYGKPGFENPHFVAFGASETTKTRAGSGQS